MPRRSLWVALFLVACAPKNEPAPEVAGRRSEPPRVSAPTAPPRSQEQRCAGMTRSPGDELSVVVEDADGALPGALARQPADAAAEWAEVLRRISKDCAGTEVEHALPSTRVTLRTPVECKPGGKTNELTFDFSPSGTGSVVLAKGKVVTAGREVGVDARITAAGEAPVLCVSGKLELPGASKAAATPERPEGSSARWLAVPFQVLGGVIGLLPVKR